MNSKLPNQITVANRSGCSGLAIQKNDGKTMLARSVPYLARQLSAFGPTRVLSQRVNQCCMSLIWMVMQGEYTGGLSWFEHKKPLRPAGGKYCIFLHLSACVGVTSCERGSRSQVSKRKNESTKEIA
jgi:hypothetical protein